MGVMGVTVIASGWWYGRYWLMVDGGTCSRHPMYWFDTALEALLFVNGDRKKPTANVV